MSLKNTQVLMFVANDYEDLELQYPKYRLIEEGAQVVVAGLKAKENYKGKHGIPCQADLAFEDVNVRDFSALIIPGGYAPDHLRSNTKVLDIIKAFHQEKKLIAFICHAGWLPASAGILNGVSCTSYHTIKDDLINAGAKWEDSACVIDGHFISSRSPADLPKFCPAIIRHLSQVTV